MKCALLTVIGLGAGFVTPACILPPYPQYSCPTATYNEDVGFDDIRAGSVFAGTYYHHLFFDKLTVQDVDKGKHARGLLPHSAPNYALSPRGANGGPYDTSYLSIGGNTTTFDMNSLWIGCLAPSATKTGYAAIACHVSMDCSAPSTPEGHLGPRAYPYQPSGPTDAKMIQIAPQFKFCTEFIIGISGNVSYFGSDNAILVVDNLSYVAREGEVQLSG